MQLKLDREDATSAESAELAGKLILYSEDFKQHLDESAVSAGDGQQDKANLLPRYIGMFTERLGKIAAYGKNSCPEKPIAGKFAADTFERLLAILTRLEIKPNARDISTTLRGLGQLAQASWFEGKISAELLVRLLIELKAFDHLTAQDIADSLYGLGLLAKVGQLKGHVSAKLIAKLLKQLVDPELQLKLTVSSISGSLYGLGLLAKAGQLTGHVSAKLIAKLLGWLVSPELQLKLTVRAISSSLYGFGLLAKAGQLKGHVSAKLIAKLLEQLVDPGAQFKLDARGIANSFYGVGLLAQAGHLKHRVSAKLIVKLLEQLVDPERQLKPTAQHISHSFYGLGLLAKAGHLKRRVSTELIEKLLKQLVGLEAQSKLDALGIANSLYGVGLLAQAGRLKDGVISVVSIAVLLGKLKEIDPVVQDFANSLYGAALCFYCREGRDSVDREVGLEGLEEKNPKQYFVEFLREKCTDQILTSLDKTSVSQLAQAQIFMGMPLSAQWQASLRRRFIRDDDCFQKALKKKIAGCGSLNVISVMSEALCGAWPVDLLIKTKSGKMIVVEFDGFRHYDSHGELRKQDLWRDEWLAENEYEVERVKISSFLAENSVEDICDDICSKLAHTYGEDALEKTAVSKNPVALFSQPTNCGEPAVGEQRLPSSTL